MKKKIIFSIFYVMLLIIALISMTSCSKEDETIYYTVTFNSDGGSAVEAQRVKKGDKVTRPSNPTKEGYSFEDWYYGTEKWSFVGYSVTEDIVLSARWQIRSYRLNLSVNNSDAGCVNGSGTYNYNKFVTINATTNDGYSFLGWYSGETLISSNSIYKFNMPAHKVDYEARWLPNDNIPYKVEHYQQNIYNNNYTLYETDNLYGVVDTLTNAQVREYDGFTSPTIIQDTISGDGSTVIKLYYIRNSYTVTLSSSINEAGNVTGSGTYRYGQNVVLKTQIKDGYTFVGWYYGEELITRKLAYVISMPFYDVTYEARYIISPVKLTKNNDYAGDVIIEGTMILENDITIKATTNQGYTFVGWFVDNKLLTSEEIFTSVLSINNIIYEARWIKVTVSSNLEDAGTTIGLTSSYKVGDHTTIEAITNLGYIFNGWYDEDCLITNELKYTFVMPDYDVVYKACFEVREEMANFQFTSSNTTCNIEGIKDKTVESISIPDYVTNTRICSNLFSGCIELKNIVIPSHIHTIEYNSFYENSNLQNVYYNGTIEDWCNIYFEPNNKIYTLSSYYCYTNPMSYASNFYLIDNNGSIEFYGNKYTLLDEIILPNTITSISYKTFYGFNNIKKIDIPDSVEYIGERAFSNCSSLEEIKIPKSVKYIHQYALYGCSSLERLELPFVGNKREISTNYYYPFGYIFGLSAYEGGVATTQMDYRYEKSYDIKAKYYIPLTLKEVIITDCEFIQESAFCECDGLVNIIVPNNLKIIGNCTFSGCSSLIEFLIPEGVTSIGYAAFRNCSKLTSILIPKSVESIDSYAFYDCTSLLTVYYEFTQYNPKISFLTNATMYYYSEIESTNGGNYWYYVDGVVTKW